MTIQQGIHRRAVLTLAHHDFERGLNVHAYFKMSDHAISQDLVQDTFLKTWNYLVKGGEILMMKSFLYHILNNLIIDEYRKHKTTSLDLMLENGFEPSVDEKISLFDFLDGKGAALLIKRLPFIYQKVMRMKYIQDLSVKEMSVITGQTNNAIAVQAHRGLEKLKVLYRSQVGTGLAYS